MTLFMIIAPFATFATLLMLVPAKLSLAAGAMVALIAMIWDLANGRSVKMLSLGAFVLFSLIGGYLTIVGADWSSTAIRLAVDGGVLAMALGSLAVRFPFTLQYARETVEPEIMKLPGFMRVNYILTWVWTSAFVLMLAVDVIAIYLPSFPLWACAGIAFAARNGAVYFTKWYPNHRRAAAAGLARDAMPRLPALARTASAI
ncbi:hypothetical protein [Afipia sp. Root123D2]|uniref:hypothetical protein n=1 Tax=Afipia sp. Root123D2 TaxID=1736436 RepID=UPI000ACDD4DC|nr:hypothetical protein [Afipia sp. Root123D2]